MNFTTVYADFRFYIKINFTTDYADFRYYIKINFTTDYADYADFQDYVRNTFPRVRVQK